MSNPEQPTTPEIPSTPDEAAALAPQPTQLPPASELPESAPLAAEPFAPAAEPFAPADTQVLPPVDPNAATQAFPPAAPAYPGAPEAPAYGAPVPPVAPGAPYGAAQQPGAQAPMNTLALVAFIGSFFVGLVGIICGHISLKQIKRDGTRGRGFALAGTIIGYVATIGWIIGIIMLIVGSIAAAGLASAASDEFDKQLESQIEEMTPDTTETPAPDSADGVTPSAEFCTALEESASIDPSDATAVSEAYQRLAANAPSPKSAELYAKLAQLTVDPAAALDDPNFDITTFQEQLTETLMADAMGCV